MEEHVRFRPVAHLRNWDYLWDSCRAAGPVPHVDAAAVGVRHVRFEFTKYTRPNRDNRERKFPLPTLSQHTN